MLGEEGYGLTVAARRPDKLSSAADELRSIKSVALAPDSSRRR
jgi:hypothetical protein